MDRESPAGSEQVETISYTLKGGDPRPQEGLTLGVSKCTLIRVPPGIVTKDELLRAVGVPRP